MLYFCVQGYQVSLILETLWGHVAKFHLFLIAVTTCRHLESAYHLCQFFDPFLSSENDLLCCYIFSHCCYASQFILTQFLYSALFQESTRWTSTFSSLSLTSPCSIHVHIFFNPVINSLKAGTLFCLLSSVSSYTWQALDKCLFYWRDGKLPEILSRSSQTYFPSRYLNNIF